MLALLHTPGYIRRVFSSVDHEETLAVTECRTVDAHMPLPLPPRIDTNTRGSPDIQTIRAALLVTTVTTPPRIPHTGDPVHSILSAVCCAYTVVGRVIGFPRVAHRLLRQPNPESQPALERFRPTLLFCCSTSARFEFERLDWASSGCTPQNKRTRLPSPGCQLPKRVWSLAPHHAEPNTIAHRARCAFYNVRHRTASLFMCAWAGRYRCDVCPYACAGSVAVATLHIQGAAPRKENVAPLSSGSGLNIYTTRNSR